MKYTLHRSSGIDWYVTDSDLNVIGHTVGMKDKKLLSLANIEEKVRFYHEYKEREAAGKYIEQVVFRNGITWAKSHYKVPIPDTYEVEIEMTRELMFVSKIIKAIL